MADQEDDFLSLPLQGRWLHKLWKARVSAYQEASGQFENSTSERDPCFRMFNMEPNLFKRAVADSNVVAQEAGINCYISFLRYGGREACIHSRSYILPLIVEKGLSSMKSSTKIKSTQALSLMIELDTPDPVITELIDKGLSLKSPKAVQAAISSIREQFRLFGPRAISPKFIIKEIPQLFGQADAGIRRETLELTVELYRWLSDSLKPLVLTDLKSAQVTDLEKAFESVKHEKPRTPERVLRSEKATQETQAFNEQISESEDDNRTEFDLVESVHVIKQLPKDMEKRLASTKWSDRKGVLDEVFQLANKPKLDKNEDYTSLFRDLSKSLKDANILCVQTAANCIGAIARGLQTEISRYKSYVSTPLFEKLKEKKQSVVEALNDACDSIYKFSNIYEDLDEIITFAKHKNPQIRAETTNLLCRTIAKSKTFPDKSSQKAIAEAALINLSDTAEPVRTAAAELLGTLMKLIGERAMNTYIEKVEDIRKAKILEYFEIVEVKAKPPVQKNTKKLNTGNFRDKSAEKSNDKIKKNYVNSPYRSTTSGSSETNSMNNRRSLSRQGMPTPDRRIKATSDISMTPHNLTSKSSLTKRTLQKNQPDDLQFSNQTVPVSEKRMDKEPPNAADYSWRAEMGNRFEQLEKQNQELADRVNTLQNALKEIKDENIKEKIYSRVKDSKLENASQRITELERALQSMKVNKSPVNTTSSLTSSFQTQKSTYPSKIDFGEDEARKSFDKSRFSDQSVKATTELGYPKKDSSSQMDILHDKFEKLRHKIDVMKLSTKATNE